MRSALFTSLRVPQLPPQRRCCGADQEGLPVANMMQAASADHEAPPRSQLSQAHRQTIVELLKGGAGA